MGFKIMEIEILLTKNGFAVLNRGKIFFEDVAFVIVLNYALSMQETFKTLFNINVPIINNCFGENKK